MLRIRQFCTGITSKMASNQKDKKPKSNLLECPICQEIFTDPKVLPCGHSFCLQCLLKLAPQGTQNIKCPLCQRETNVPNGDVNGFTTNFGLRDAVEDMGPEPEPEPPDDPDKSKNKLLRNIAIGGAAAVGGVAFAAAIPFVILPAIGFTSAGIAAGSAAAGMMSASAIASGGGVAAGSAVAVAQSVGAAGLAASTYAAAGAAAGTAGFAAAEAATRFKKGGSGDGNEGGDNGNDGGGVDGTDGGGGGDGDDAHRGDGDGIIDGADEAQEDGRQPGGEGTEVGLPQNNRRDDDDDVQLSKLAARKQDPSREN